MRWRRAKVYQALVVFTGLASLVWLWSGNNVGTDTHGSQSLIATSSLGKTSGGPNRDSSSSSPTSSARRILRRPPLKYFPELTSAMMYGLDLASKRNRQEARNEGLEAAVPNRTVLVVATWRSGSTFLAQLIAHFPNTFYTFEPLIETVSNSNRSGFSAEALLSSILQCDLNGLSFNDQNDWLLKHNFRYQQVCSSIVTKDRKNLCPLAPFLSSACQRYPVRLVKTVRLLANATLPLLRHQSDLRVVFLFRDPRGIATSRRYADWCVSECGDTAQMCHRLSNDVRNAFQTKRMFPNRVYILRYEDLCLNVSSEAAKLLSFLGLQMTPMVEDFIASHTSLERAAKDGFGKSVKVFLRERGRSSFSTYRDSVERAFAWRRVARNSDISVVEDKCAEAMDNLGYVKVSQVEEGEGVKLVLRGKDLNDVAINT